MDPALVPENAVIAERDGDRIRLQTNLRDADLVKLIPGHRWDRTAKMWTLWLSWSACVQLRGVFGDRLVVGPKLEAWSWDEYNSRVAPCLALRDAEDVEGERDEDLYPRQRAGVEFLVHAKHALLGDEVGAGKTRQVIKTLERRGTYPAIIIATKSGKDAWIEEYEKVAPHRTVVNVGGGATKRRKLLAQEADVYVVHWDILRLHSRLAGYGYIKLKDEEKEPKELNAIPKRAVVTDEGHKMQDPTTKQTRAAWALGDEVDDDEGARIVATGTPIDKDISQAWPLLRFIAPREYPSKTAFIDRYALQTWSPFGFSEIAGLLPEHKEEFFKFFDARFLRRPTKVVVPWLPDPIRMPPRKVELKGKQKKAYVQMRDGLLAEIGDGTVMAKDPLTQMVRLRQLAAAYGEAVEDPQTGKTTLRLTTPSVVVDELIDVLAELGDTQALVFSESRQLMELASQRMAKEDVQHGLITGAVPETERTARRKAFQAGKLRVLGLTVGAGGESLTLTGAKAMIFIERPFSLKKNKQAEGRAVRPGQDERVLIIDIVPTLGQDKDGDDVPTVASAAHDALVYKGQNFEELVRDQQTLRRVLGK